MKCRLCGGNCTEIFQAKVLSKYDIRYFHCSSCNLVQTEEPYWLEESYNNPINDTDTGLVKRNLSLSNLTSTLLYFLFDKNAKYLDYGGGYGLFVRLMRDKGFDFYWNDPYTENILAKGFEYNSKDRYLAVTAFELFEHLVNPSDEIEKMLKISDSIIFSTELIDINNQSPLNWWYFGLEHGQHVSFYSTETLNYIAQKYDLNLYTNNKNFHLLTKKSINPILFKVLQRLSKRDVFRNSFIKLKSKTVSDMNLVISKLNNER